GRLALIDWDRLQLADPARDIAGLGCWYWVRALRHGRTPDWQVLGRATAAYDTWRSRAAVTDHLRFHIAAALVRLAYDLFRWYPEDGSLVPRLTAEVFRQLR